MFDINDRNQAEQVASDAAELLKGSNQLLERIAQGEPLSLTLDSLVRFIETQCPGMLGSILLLDPDGIHVRHGAAPSLPETYIRSIDGEPIGPHAGSCGTAAFRREPVIVEDIATDPLWDNYREFVLRYGLRACWSTPIFDEQQRVLGTFALYYDSPCRPSDRHWAIIRMATHTAAIAIVKHRETEALRASEARLRLAVTSGNLGIWEWEIAADHLIWSEELKDIFGFPRENKDLTINTFWDVVHPEDRCRVQDTVGLALAEHADFQDEYRILRPNGSLRWIAAHGRAAYDDAGAPLRMIGVAMDITARKLAQEEIGRSQSQLAEAQRIAQLGSYEWDVASDCVYRSEELYGIFGLLPGDFKPTFQGYLERVHPEDRSATKETIERAFRERQAFDLEERIVRPDGSVRLLHSRGRWILDGAHQPVRLVGTCQDITERKKIEEKLRAVNAALADELAERTRTEQEIQALSAKLIKAQEEERTRLARELHDDLSQQIAALSIATSNLRKGIAPECRDALAQSERIQQKLVQLAEGVRRISHELHPAILQHAGLAVALRTYCSEFETLTGIRVSVETHGSLDQIDPSIALCLYRVGQEALQNVARHAKVDKARVELKDTGEVLLLRISDRGIGITSAPASRPAGLGLISIRERARLVNGTVRIESQPNQGTTLTLRVPRFT